MWSSFRLSSINDLCPDKDYWDEVVRQVRDEFKSFDVNHLVYRTSYDVDPNDSSKKVLCYEIDLPGVKRDDLSVNVGDRNALWVAWKKKDKTFSHKIIVDSRYDASKTSAKLEDGVLTLTIELANCDSKKTIPIL